MFSNKKFAFQAVLLMIASTLMMFFYIGLLNDHLNILTPYLQSEYGWSDLTITNPVTQKDFAASDSDSCFSVFGSFFCKWKLPGLFGKRIFDSCFGCALTVGGVFIVRDLVY